MGTRFAITAKETADIQHVYVELGDIATYTFDATPWQEDNDTIIAATWTLENGSATISDEENNLGIVSAIVAFQSTGSVVISVLFSTLNLRKKVYLIAHVSDSRVLCCDSDYGGCL